MNTIELRNFKSYEYLLLANVHPKINVILGKNGQGKSNFFKALTFLLSDKISLNQTQWSNTKFKGLNGADNNKVQVEIILEGKNEERTKWRLSKAWNQIKTTGGEDKIVEQFYQEDTSITKEQFQNLIEFNGFRYENPYNIVQQGKIIEIASMNQYQIFKLLEQATGLKKIYKKIKQARNTLQKGNKQKQEIQQSIKDLEQKFIQMNQKRQEFQIYQNDEKIKKIKNKKKYSQKILHIDNQLNQEKQIYQNNLETLINLKNQEEKYKQYIQQLQSKIKIIQTNINYYENQKEQFIHIQPIQSTQQIKGKQKRLQKIRNQIKKGNDLIQKMNKQGEIIRKQFINIQEKYQSLKDAYDVDKKTKKKQQLMKQHQQQILNQEKNINQILSQIEKLKTMKNNSSLESTHQKNINQLKQIQQQKIKINLDVRNNKINLINLNRQKNQVEGQIQVIKSQKSLISQKLKKALPLIDFHLIQCLKQQNIQGIYGYFLQLVQINQDLLLVYQMAGLNKLTSLIVKDEFTCQQVIRINKKIKGKQINIIPLTYIQKIIQQRSLFEGSDDAFSLVNQDLIKVKINPNRNYPQKFQNSIKKLIYTTFSKHLVVKDYDVALKNSKKYHLNCITKEGEIVYSQGYLCKVGGNRINQSRLSLFNKYISKQLQQGYLKKKLEQIEQKIINSQKQELQIMKFLKKNQQHEKKIKLKLNQTTMLVRVQKKIKDQENRLIKSIKQSQQNINTKKKIIKNLNQNVIKNVNANHLKQSQYEYFKKRQSLNDHFTKIYKIKQQMVQKQKQEQQIKKQINQSEVNKKHDNPQLENKSQLVFKLKKQKEQKMKELNKLIKENEKFNIDISKIQMNNQSIMSQISLLESYRKQNLNKIKQIGSVPQNMDIEDTQNSMSHSISISKANRKLHFSVGDKTFFQSFSQRMEKMQGFIEEFKILNQTQKKIKDYIFEFQGQVQKHMAENIENFKIHFKNIFKRITIRGQSQITDNKIKEKDKDGRTKYKRYLTIDVSFNGQPSSFKKWNTYSGGEKTVIAISIIMALQRCQPAPFYVFDEIDSALDKYYIERILDVILEDSKNSQYFISSFKNQILTFPEQVCNYYLVQNQQRKSKIKQITNSAAIDQLNKIQNQ